jgi:hypothetical protein
MNIRLFLSVILLIAAIRSNAPALPRFASRTGAKCQSCHVNPAGGAMRQAFGAQYGRDRLPVPAWSKEFELEDFSNVITNVLGVGADFRTLYFSRRIPDTTSVDGFWQMQGDIYLNFRVAKKVAFFLKKGLRDGFEAYGLFNVLPASGSVKVGKFVPNYGLRTDDHTAYVRQQTGMSPETGRPERTGVEAGISPGPVSIVGGFYNGEETNFPPTSSVKAYLGRAEGMFALGNGFNLALGGNVFSRKASAITNTVYGGFGSFSVDDFTILGEADWIRTTVGAGTTRTGLATYLEGDFVVTPGLDLKVAYDFFDSDVNLKTGARSRYSFGFEFFPLSGVELRPMYRIVKEDPAAGNKDEIHILLHLYL